MWELQRKCPCALPSCPTPCAAADDPPVHPPVHQKTPGESYDSPTESPLPTLTSLPPFSMWSSLLPMFFSATDNQCWSWHFSFIPLISTLVQHLLWVTATFLWDCLSPQQAPDSPPLLQPAGAPLTEQPSSPPFPRALPSRALLLKFWSSDAHCLLLTPFSTGPPLSQAPLGLFHRATLLR